MEHSKKIAHKSLILALYQNIQVLPSWTSAGSKLSKKYRKFTILNQIQELSYKTKKGKVLFICH